MKKILILFVLIACLIPFTANATKMTDLTEETSPDTADLLWLTINVSTSAADRKITLGNLLLWMAAQTVSVGGTWTMTTPVLDTPTFTLADDSTLTLPSAASGYTGGLLSCDTDGTCDWTDPSGITGSYVPLSTFTAAGDVPVGSGSGAVTKISSGASSISTDPGANNTFFGVNNDGELGFHDSFNPVLVAAPTSDDTYSGTVASFTAGEALAQWDVVYCKNKSGVHACYKYDANGADKALPPRAMAVAAIDADASGTFLLTGIVRNDGWSQTTNQDEGKIVYCDGTTAGAITLTKSTTSADMVAILGYVIEQNVIYFNPSPILVEVP